MDDQKADHLPSRKHMDLQQQILMPFLYYLLSGWRHLDHNLQNYQQREHTDLKAAFLHQIENHMKHHPDLKP